MANINELLARAAALRDETALNSISPERAGGIMYDTLLAMNELWLQQGAALVISKLYASVAAMEADTAPVSDLTGQPLRPGQIVVIASSDSDNGSVYRYNGTSSPSWSLVGEIGNLEPVDSLDSDSTSLPLAAHQGKVLDGKISQLGQEMEAINKTNGFYDIDDSDLDICDNDGNVLAKFEKGGFRTKDFDSQQSVKQSGFNNNGLIISDENGNVLAKFSNGNIQTEKFDSANFEDVWRGKSWYAYGTSLTATATDTYRGKYTNVVAFLSGLIQHNKGIGANGITSYSNDGNFNALTDPDDGKKTADLITLEVGANDEGAPLGNIYDDTDNSTFCGALNIILKFLQENTTARIVVISSTPARYEYQHSENKYYPDTTWGTDNHTIQERNEAIKKVCDAYGVAYIPMCEECGLGEIDRMNSTFGDLYLLDQIHPTKLGGEVMGRFVWSKLKNIQLFSQQLEINN